MGTSDLPGDNQKPSERADAAMVHLEAGLNLIPFVGGFLATYFGEIRSLKVQERMQRYFAYFSERLAEMEKAKIDLEYLQSEEFAELFAQGAEQAAKSTTDRRIRRFANILIHNALRDSSARDRTQSIMSFVDRISDVDAFVLLCYGPPDGPSLRAKTKQKAYGFVEDLCRHLGLDTPTMLTVVESIIYMDNLGLTWVNEKPAEDQEIGQDLILKEFSSFRTPLGDAVTRAIAPPGFYKCQDSSWSKPPQPVDYVNERYVGAGHV